VPRCGALILLQKTPHYKWVGEIAARLNAKLWTSVTDGGGGGGDWWHLTHFLTQSSSTRKLKADTEIKIRQI
jgi:hypothetical protein